jgi:hypothetical protein
MVSIKHNLDQKNEKNKFKNILQETYLLRNIRILLPTELIYLVYSYVCGFSKLIYNVKYNYLELNLRDDCHKNYIVWNCLSKTLNALTKNQLIIFIYNNNSNIISNQYICSKIWYFSIITNKYYDRINLLNLWSGKETNENFEKEDLKSVDYMVKTRIIDAIYHYLLRSIKIYKSQKKLYKELDYPKRKIYNKNLFNEINQASYIYKSIYYINYKINNK